MGFLLAALFILAEPVWPEGHESETNLTVTFTAEFDWTGEGEARLDIAAASVYRARLNGAFAGWGPARTVRGHAVVDRIPLKARKGLNRLEIDVSGYNLNSYQYVGAPSFLTAEVTAGGRVLVATPRGFSAHEAGRSRGGPVYSRQRGFPSEIWKVGGERGAAWKLAVQPRPEYLERRAAYPAFEPVKPEAVGPHWRFPHVESGFAALDFRCLRPGRIALEFDEAVGTNGVIDLWRNGDPMKSWHAMNNRLVWDVAEPGTYHVESIEPYAMMYVRTVVESGDFADIRPSLRQCRNPRLGARFKSSDGDLDRLLAACFESLAQNSVDIFTDCPGRERVGWLCDTYFTANAAAWFTGDFAIEQEYLLNYVRAKTQGPRIPEGTVSNFMPSETGTVMPTYMMWFTLQCLQAAERLPGRERAAFLGRVRGKIEGIHRWIAGFENREGLLEDLPGWMFVEWSGANGLTKGVNFPMNMLWVRSLEKCGQAYGKADWIAKAGRTRELVRRLSLAGGRHVYHDQALRGGDGKLEVNAREKSEVCQYYAFFTEVATPERDAALHAAITADADGLVKREGLIPADAFIGWMLRCQLLSDWGLSGELCRAAKRYYGRMAEENGTLWEFADGHDSRCHAFASNVGALIMKATLGIREIDWAKREIRFARAPGELASVEAFVPLGPEGGAEVGVHVENGKPVRTVRLPSGWNKEEE